MLKQLLTNWGLRAFCLSVKVMQSYWEEKKKTEKVKETGLHNPQVCHTLFLSMDEEKSTSSYFAVKLGHMSSLN